MNSQNKKILFWGTGRKCKQILQCYPELQPYGFIDSNINIKYFDGKIVYHPDDIINWNDFFYVIVNFHFEEISAYLEKKGMLYQKDYVTFYDFLSVNRVEMERVLDTINKYVILHPECKNATLVLAPFYFARGSQNVRLFWKEYSRTSQCIGLIDLDIISTETAVKEMGFPFFYCSDNKIIKDGLCRDELDEEDRSWIYEYYTNISSISRDSYYSELLNRYNKYKKIISLIQPRNLVVWGCWGYRSLMLENIAKRIGVPFLFMEYGWLPGTFQFDKYGFGGQSQYISGKAHETVLQIIDAENKALPIKEYVTKSRIDSGNSIFKYTEKDKKNISALDGNRKTVFLVGMGEKQMFIDSNSLFWKQSISAFFSSTEDLLQELIQICKKHSWNLIFKPHPEEEDIIGVDWENYREDIILIRDMAIDELISMSDVVVSMHSAVNYKVLLYGKPLVQAGYTLLYHTGCAYDLEKREELEQKIEFALKDGMTKNQKQIFDKVLCYACETYLWDDQSERSIRYGLSPDIDLFEAFFHHME